MNLTEGEQALYDREAVAHLQWVITTSKPPGAA